MLITTRESDRRCRLRPSQRAMVALVHLPEHTTPAEIAVGFGISESTVHAYTHRVLRRGARRTAAPLQNLDRVPRHSRRLRDLRPPSRSGCGSGRCHPAHGRGPTCASGGRHDGGCRCCGSSRAWDSTAPCPRPRPQEVSLARVRRHENPATELVSRWARTCWAVTNAQSGGPDRLRKDRLLGATPRSAAGHTVEDLQPAWDAFLSISATPPVASRWPDAFG